MPADSLIGRSRSITEARTRSRNKTVARRAKVVQDNMARRHRTLDRFRI